MFLHVKTDEALLELVVDDIRWSEETYGHQVITACSEWKKRWKLMNYWAQVMRILMKSTQRIRQYQYTCKLQCCMTFIMSTTTLNVPARSGQCWTMLDAPNMEISHRPEESKTHHDPVSQSRVTWRGVGVWPFLAFSAFVAFLLWSPAWLSLCLRL